MGLALDEDFTQLQADFALVTRELEALFQPAQPPELSFWGFKRLVFPEDLKRTNWLSSDLVLCSNSTLEKTRLGKGETESCTDVFKGGARQRLRTASIRSTFRRTLPSTCLILHSGSPQLIGNRHATSSIRKGRS